MKLDNQYFVLNQSGPIWDRIVMSRRVSVSGPAEINEPRMELLVVTEQVLTRH